MMLKAHQKFQLNHNQIYIIVHRSWLKMNRVLRASLRVPHPRLPFLFFLAKTEKIFSNSSPSQVAIYAKFGKRASTRVYMRARIRGASVRIRRGGRA